MKPSKRLTTNQTNSSNKKPSQQNPSFQLPKINKTSNYDTNSNLSYEFQYDEQKGGNELLSEILENEREQVGIVNYEKMTMEEIKREYQRLRQEVTTLTHQVKKRQQLQQSKMMKKQSRISNPQQIQKKLSQTQQQLYQSSQVLSKLRLQYQQLQKRSNLANSSISRPNAQMNDKILTARQKILTLKQKIKLLKRKTKKTGNDIVNGDNIHEDIEKLQREEKAILAKHSSLQGKIQESAFKISRQDQKLGEIQMAYSNAQDYLKLFKLQNQQIVQKNGLFQEYKQKSYRVDILRKKIQTDQQSCLQKYHQLLKLFQIESQKQQKLDKKLIDSDVNILKARNVILDLENELEQVEDIMTRLSQQQQLKKQAQHLRKVMERQQYAHSDTFVTQNSLGNTLNSHMRGVKSIIEENQSDVRETIEMNDEKQTIGNDNNGNRLRIKTKDKMMFTKLQQKAAVLKKDQFKSLTAKNTTAVQDQVGTMPVGKYYLSSKEISKKRQQQKNVTSMRKQSSIKVTEKAGRKAYSVLKPNDSSKLKQLSLNRTSKNTPHQIRSLKIMQPVKHQPYLHLNPSNNSHQHQIQRGKEILRQRKNSLKVVTNQQGSNGKQVRKNDLLEQLEEINRKLEEDFNQDEGVVQGKQSLEHQKEIKNLEKTKPIQSKQTQNNQVKVSQNQVRLSQESNRGDMNGKITKPGSKQGNKAKPQSKQGKIRHQPAIKPQVLQQIDKSNIEYTRKIQELKRQLSDKQLPPKKQSRKQQASLGFEAQQIIESQKVIAGELSDRKEIAQEISPMKVQKQVQDKIQVLDKRQQQAQSQVDSDDDIDQDISEINKMIKQKLQSQTAVKAQ